MFEDPKRNQQDQNTDDYKGIQQDEGSLGGVASQDTGETSDLGDFGTNDVDQSDTEDDMTQ